MDVVSPLVGVALILTALHDVFRTLLRPSTTGRLTHVVFRAMWRLRRRRRGAGLAGGAAMVVVTIGLWITLLAIGWALIYLPHVPDGFQYAGVDPDIYHPFAEALTYSLVALTTLGLGDAVPTDPLVRLLSPLEALTGLALVSAAVAWSFELYPALARRRALAIELNAMHVAGVTADPDRLGPNAAPEVVRLAGSLAVLTADLVQNTEIFYFTERDERLSVARAIGFALEMRDAAAHSPRDDLRAASRVLAATLDELVRVLRDRYSHVHGDTVEDVLDAVARSHGHSLGA